MVEANHTVSVDHLVEALFDGAGVENSVKAVRTYVSRLRSVVGEGGDLQFGEPRVVELKGIAGSHTVHPVLWDPDSYSSM